MNDEVEGWNSTNNKYFSIQCLKEHLVFSAVASGPEQESYLFPGAISGIVFPAYSATLHTEGHRIPLIPWVNCNSDHINEPPTSGLGKKIII